MRVIVAICATIPLRLFFLYRFWVSPRRIDKERFFTSRIEPETARRMLRRYRFWLLVPLVVDAAIVAAIAWSGRLRASIIFEQVAAAVVIIFFQYILTFYVAARARALELAGAPLQPRAVSLEARRLRDSTSWSTEFAIVTMTAAGLVAFARLHGSFWEAILDVRVVWMIYAPLGLFLFKHVLIRARLQLPLSRVDDFKRWRAAWIAYMLRMLDAIRLSFSLLLLAAALAFLSLERWPWISRPMVTAVMAATVLLTFMPLMLRLRGAGKRLEALQNEIRLFDILEEIPPSAVPDGRFLAGGTLFINRDQPAMFVRSPTGLAINLASSGTYAWAGYLSGLLALGVLEMLY